MVRPRLWGGPIERPAGLLQTCGCRLAVLLTEAEFNKAA